MMKRVPVNEKNIAFLEGVFAEQVKERKGRRMWTPAQDAQWDLACKMVGQDRLAALNMKRGIIFPLSTAEFVEA